MKIKGLFVCTLLMSVLGSCTTVAEKKKEENRPNIVMFLVDDMGWQDTSVPFWDRKTPFNDRYHTPNMERLAIAGMKFTQAYATPVCSPTRVSFLTGMNAARHKVTNWTLRKNASNDAKDDLLEFPQWNVNGLSPEEGTERTVYATPLPQVLQDNGYFTVHAGKAHFGAIGTPGENPLNLGFNVNIAGHAAGAPESYLGTENFGNGKEGKAIWAVPGLEKYHGQDIFLTEALTREALSSLDTVPENKPFFLYMSHYAVHTPLYGDKRFMQKYIDMGLDEREAKYASMIEGMDKSLGDIMDYLEKTGKTDNTIILFMSDNGGLSAHARGGEPNTHNKPLASGKGSMYEGGIREPMLVSWPGKVRAGSVTDEKVIIEDFYPTIIEMAGIKNPEVIQKIDGISFTSVLEEKEGLNKERAFYWHYPNKWGGRGPGIGTASAVRKGDWKLIYFYKDQSFELYHISEDIGELNNLAEKNPEKAKELATLLSDYLREVGAQLPINKETQETMAYPDQGI
ncbi:sulfatase [Zhouia spongiae]|uniref:Sulfatase n=1 Tax=Zhouia spongiae TaxID=2202721 RepID=A0ABY3YIW2_9FLAO|nr:sulfatase [Zhouia spongiae]UNY97461.1 sulfatase [Zhouia spongiae]